MAGWLFPQGLVFESPYLQLQGICASCLLWIPSV